MELFLLTVYCKAKYSAVMQWIKFNGIIFVNSVSPNNVHKLNGIIVFNSVLYMLNSYIPGTCPGAVFCTTNRGSDINYTGHTQQKGQHNTKEWCGGRGGLRGGS